ncbi:LysR family transcriptional regulator [Companilactobacillus mishanensis]|uniref:LysR family transcriptional regulator n=1 Tax=Companilactobacillus mishanensis TaxID=2486008 RepID=A0A5P0ZK07_9LACO|nr:LysR family transcriptional regulator [Companilactobacillus mishanensis]MQS53441.1 LysR family transcriptional regulator [Companilactobacillus mishanensis]
MKTTDRLISILDEIQLSRTLTAVADKLYLSQPYISRLLNEMEQRYGVKLVNRHEIPISLTHAGQVVCANLKKIQDAENNLDMNLVGLQREAQKTISIGLCSLVNEKSLSDIAVILHQNFQDTKFNLKNWDGELTDRDLISGKLDIIVGQKWNNPALHIVPFQLQELSMLLPETCPLYQEGVLFCPFSQDNLSSLNNSNYVMVSDGSFLQQKVNSFLEENKIQINKIMEMPNSRLSVETAIKLHATTITTTKIAESVLTNGTKYNLMKLPVDILSLNMALSYLQDASPEVKKVGDKLLKLIDPNTEIK